MNINTIYNDESLINYLKRVTNQYYYKYKLKSIIEYDDFEQEVNISLIKKIKSFDDSKSDIKTFINYVVSSTGKDSLKKRTGQAKDFNKLEVEMESKSLDFMYMLGEGEVTHFGNYIVGTEGIENESIDNVLVTQILHDDSLSDIQKTILKLFYEGYTKTEIYRTLKIKENTVNYHFRKIKEKMSWKLAY